MSDTVLVDSNVLSDIIHGDVTWLAWSSAAVAAARNTGRVAINPLIYAELSVLFRRKEELDATLLDYRRLNLPWDAAFLAGKAFVAYRRAGGPRRSPLPDFYIGAHAAVAGMRLLTRDATRYRTYFPRLDIIAP